MVLDIEHTANNINTGKQAVFIFDSDCSLCIGFASWLGRLDKNRRFFFATLSDCKNVIGSLPEDTVLLITGGKILTRSTAIFAAISMLGKKWKLAHFFLSIPQNISDFMYTCVAKRRLRICSLICKIKPRFTSIHLDQMLDQYDLRLLTQCLTNKKSYGVNPLQEEHSHTNSRQV